MLLSFLVERLVHAVLRAENSRLFNDFHSSFTTLLILRYSLQTQHVALVEIIAINEHFFKDKIHMLGIEFGFHV